MKYGIIFDAGSSGSRIHVYSFYGGGTRGPFKLIKDDLLKKKPGLSSFKSNPKAAGSSLDPLLEHALGLIPDEKRATAPVFLMATAGLRLVGEETAELILESVRDKLRASAFLFNREWAYILPGEDEGVFGWVTVNYLLESFEDNMDSTTGVLDLGGGSVQIVFESKEDNSEDGGAFTSTEVSGHTYQTYVHSHLGYGLDQARAKVLSEVVKSSSVEGGADIEHPCYPTGYNWQVSEVGHDYTVVGASNQPKCVAMINKMFDKSTCSFGSCAFNNVFQPKLPDKVVAFSYFYDRTAAIGLIDSKPKIYGRQEHSVAAISEAAKTLCAKSWEEMQIAFKEVADASKMNHFCFDTLYLSELLLNGFGFAPDQMITVANKLSDVELVWTLGAMVAKAHLSTSTSSTPIWFIAVAIIALVFVFCFGRLLLRGGYPGYHLVQKARP